MVMAASQPGTSSSAQIADNRIFLFRLQMLIVDGGLTCLRNYVDQELAAQSTTLSASLAKEKTTIKLLKGRKIITQVQYDLLFPSSGTVSTLDLDITLIICLMRKLQCFKFNKKFDWSTQPVQSDTSIEADICRLKFFRNEICHISATTGIQHNDFINKWQEIEQILLRIDQVYPIKDFQQTIADFKSSIIDPETEKMVTDEIEKWSKFDKSVETDLEQLKTDTKVLKQTIEAHTKELAENIKRISENKEGLKTVNLKIAKIEKQLPAEDNYHQRKLELKDDLMRFYKWSHSKVLLSPLFEEKDTPLAFFYIRPELNVNTLQEMFKTEGLANREIYLKADAGLGKTTFSKYLATSWYQAHCPDENDVPYFKKNDIDCMRDFDFVFLVLLRDSSISCSVDELIFKLIVSNLANSKSFTEELMQELLCREKCLVILDGLDEWTHPNTQCERGPRSIPHRNCVRENCTILTTTRPWKLGDLNLSSNELGKTVELTELSYNSAVTLVTRTLLRLKSPPHNMSIEFDDATLVNEIFKSRVAHLAYVPLLLMYMICLRCEGFNIGNSKCELYVKIVELLLFRTTQKYGDISQSLSSSDVPACIAEHDKCKEYFPLLVNLGQLAYHTLSNETRENTLVFDRSVTENYLKPEEMKFTLHSGILSQSTARKLIKKVSKVSFSHKTVQEFFAAIFISSEKEAQTIVQEKCRNVQDILDMSKIWEFVSELNYYQMCAISNEFVPVINEDKKTRDYRTMTGREYMYVSPMYYIQVMFMSCLQEMPDREKYIQLCLQDFFINQDTVHSKQLQRLLKQNKSNIKSLNINIRNISSSLREIINLFSLTDLSHIQKLCYYGDRKEAEINQILFPSLQNVALMDGEWINDEENLSENFGRLQNLQYLYIDNFTFSHKILETFYKFISGQISMKELTLRSFFCQNHGCYYRNDCKGLNLDLSQHSTLSKLKLRFVHGSLQLNISTPSLVNVNLWDMKLDERSLLLSRDMLNIEHVKLGWIEMSPESLQNFITVLENLPQSVTVIIKYSKYIRPETEYKRVIENIQSSQTFHVIQEQDERFEFKTIKPSKE